MCPVTFTQGGQFVITHPVSKGDEGIVIFADRCIDSWWDKGDVQAEPYIRRHHLSDGMYLPGVRSCPRTLGGDQRQQTGGQGGGQGGRQQQQQNDSRAPSTSTIQIRTEKGDHYIELTGAEQQGQSAIDIIVPYSGQEAIEGKPGPNVNIVCVRCNIKASEKVHIESPLVEVTGDIKAKGEISAKAEVQNSDDFGGQGRVGFVEDITPFAGNEVKLSTHKHSDVATGNAQTGAPVPGT
jgi:hypothetical protein